MTWKDLMKEDKIFSFNMTWKNEIRKEKKDDDYDEYRDGETLQANNMIRDTRSAESYKTGDSSRQNTTKEILDKIAEEIRDAFEGIDYNLLMNVIMPHGRTKTFKDKEELVDDMVETAINRIKSQLK